MGSTEETTSWRLARLEERVGEIEGQAKEIGKGREEAIRLEGAFNTFKGKIETRITQLQWLLGLLVLSILGLAFAVLRKGLI